MDPNDEKDMKAAHQLQDAISIEQADIGKFEVPDWNKEEVEQMRETINVVPEKIDGQTAYTLTAKDVPVDAFWSMTLYDDEGCINRSKRSWMEVGSFRAR